MCEELENAFHLFDLDPRVRCIVVTGSGRMFCVGADLEVGFGPLRGRDNTHGSEHRDTGGVVSMAIHQCSKPTIFAINGSAVGIGITMTLPGVIRVAYKDAKVGFVFSRRAIVTEAGSSFFLPRLIGSSRALHLITTGSVYPASHPLLANLFSEILPTPEATVSRALELAADIAANTSLVSTKLMREMIYRGADSAEGAHLLDSRVMHGMLGSKDNDEGVNAFLEKRPALFKGMFPEDAPAAYPWWEQPNTRLKPKVILPKDIKL
jgi:enoyl-CoA hydratase/carnithine racemase